MIRRATHRLYCLTLFASILSSPLVWAGDPISLQQILEEPKIYHLRHVTVRGTVRGGLVHALPEAGHRSRGNRDSALLLLSHPVGGCRTIMDLTELVAHAGVIEDPLGGSRLPGVDVCGDTDIAIALDGSLACHSPNLAFLNLQSGRKFRHSVLMLYK